MSMFREAQTADGKKGQVSMRRVLAAFFSVTGVSLAVLCIVFGSPWQVVLVVFGASIIAVLLLMFFTTWSDIASIAGIIKG